MQWLAALSVRRPVFAAVLILSIVVIGLASFSGLPVDRFPDVKLPIVVVTTDVPGYGPREVERQVTERIEESVGTVSSIERLDSQSTEGLSIVFAQFALSRDVRDAATDVRERVQRAMALLPAGARTPRVEAFNPNDAPIALLALRGERTAPELAAIADRIVRRRVQGIAGVGAVSILGARERQLRVEPDLVRLGQHGLSVADLHAALTSQSVDAPGVEVLAADRAEPLRLRARAESAADLEDLVVRQGPGVAVRVRDVAAVRDTEAPQRSMARVDGEDSVVLAIRKRARANTVQLVRELEAVLPAVRADLPSHTRIDLVRDESEFTERAVHSVEEHLLVGSILAALVVLAFLRSGRSTVIAALAIPASIVATFGALRAFGLTLDTITLLGLTLAVGIVIDDAIVVLENITRTLEEKDVSPVEAAIEGTREIGLAVLATTLSLVAVFLPVAFMDGIVGRFLASFGLTMSFSILVSMLVAFTLTPMLAARWLKKPAAHGHAPPGPLSLETDGVTYTNAARGLGLATRGTWLERIYVRLLAWCMTHRAWVVGAIVLTLASILPLADAVPKTFLPAEDESRFEVSLRLPEGTSLAETARVAGRIARAVRELGGVEHTVVTAGSAPSDPTGRGPNEASVYVGLVDPAARERSQAELMAEVRARVLPNQRAQLDPGAQILVGPIDAFGASGSDAATIQWVVRGPDLARLDTLTHALLDEATRIPGTFDHGRTLRSGAPETALLIDRPRAAARQVDAQSLAGTLALLSGETVVGTLDEPGARDVVEVRLAPSPSLRSDREALLDAHVRSATGALVPLRDVVRTESRRGPASISRTDRERQVTISMNVAEGVSEQGVLDALRAAELRLGFPAGYGGQPAGNARELERTAQGFLFAIALSFVFMYLVIAAQFESFVDPVVILASLPLTVPFALVSLLVTGQSLNVFSALGVLVLFGVVKKNAILQVDHVRQLRQRGVPRAQAILEGNRDRLRPILMTTLAFVIGALPLVVSSGAGAGTNRAIGVVVMGGQSLSLLLTLVATPVLASLVEDARVGVARLRGSPAPLRASTSTE